MLGSWADAVGYLPAPSAEALRSVAVLLTTTGLPRSWFSACCSGKSCSLPNSGKGLIDSRCLASCSSIFLRSSARAFSRASSLAYAAPGFSDKCLFRSASRVRSAANTLPSAVSSSQMSGTMPLVWIDRPLGV